jgi:hypothetical protein
MNVKVVAVVIVITGIVYAGVYHNRGKLEVQTEHFTIVYQKGDGELAQQIAVIAEDAYDFDTYFMDFYPEKKIEIKIFSSVAALLEAGESTIHMGSPQYMVILVQPEWSAGSADCYIEYIVAHELIHELYYQKVAPVYEPAWLQEGLAVYAGYKFTGGDDVDNTVRQAYTMRDELSLDDMYEQCDTAYVAGPAIIAFMVDVFGREKFCEFLNTLSEWDFSISPQDNVAAALEEAFGLDYESFEGAWLTFLEEKNSQLLIRGYC